MCVGIPISRRLPLTVKCAYGGEAFRAQNLHTDINYTMKVHLRRRCHPAKLTYNENEDIVIGYSMSTYDFGKYPP